MDIVKNGVKFLIMFKIGWEVNEKFKILVINYFYFIIIEICKIYFNFVLI